ncbi:MULTISPECIES: BA14K family protein [Rhodopseudomonas]|uniref:Lectin-like protein BA14k n=1 Tax=Rhodopseudomonas palustris TaxID=1076 RepID=A0A0D7EHZ4_RHOPL|nr:MULTISPECIES: BA14K family protein [Rhodopseudomonas]KIZ40266.1 hypothetical protein OO17_18115 [Rhodopseudomonas palustris]MDF3811296.1 BA14K family protein [Rhodopseudomonas sp. BAL398]WOK18622.1 BA14K family protein [Rhodopseudomonas sp. BAL398]
MHFPKLITAAAMMGAMSFASLQPAAAAPMTPLQAATASDASGATVQNVRWRGHRGWRGHHGYYRGGYHHRGWNRDRYGWGPGAAIGGLAAGALIGGAIANSRAEQQSSDDAYCSQRFKSYDPSSGTYLGYDGNRHACP